MPRCLILQLEGPLSAYGAEMVDARGPVRDWPGASLLTGLLANALGFERHETARLQSLQDRLRFAVRIDRSGERIRDFQTAQLNKDDRGWTTRGRPEERGGGAGTYTSPHIRERDYFADSLVTVALTLTTANASPNLDEVARALVTPARPLFLGRKPCLPSRPVYNPVCGLLEAASLFEALRTHSCEAMAGDVDIISLTSGDEPSSTERLHVTDRRNWITGVHAGERIFVRSRLSTPPQEKPR